MSRLLAGPSCTVLLQTQGLPSAQAGHIELFDLALDGNFSRPDSILRSANGALMESLSVRRCEFRKFVFAALFAAGRNVRFEHCTFNNFGKGTGTAIEFTAGFEDVAIAHCRFVWCADGIIVDTDDATMSHTTQNILIEDNYFDLGWYTLPARFSGSGIGVSYTASTITDTTAAFVTDGVAPQTYFRVMPTRCTGTVSASTKRSLSDSSASFSTDGIIVGEIVRATAVDYSGFAVVSAIGSDTQLQVEEWLDDRTRQPLAPPPINASYTIYGVYLGWVTDPITGTSATMYAGRWFDLNGQEVIPANGTRYEFLPKPNYPIHMESGVRNVKILHNTLKRGYSDQISINGNDATISGNHIMWGQDMGITLGGTSGDGHSIVAENHLYKCGAGGISIVESEHSTVAHNVAKATTWVNGVEDGRGALGGIVFIRANSISVVGNVCNGQALPHAMSGIVLIDSKNITLSANSITNVGKYAVRVMGTSVGGIRSTIDNDFWSVALPFFHGDPIYEPPAPGGLYDLQGSGSPEGVVVAGPASTYRDVTNGQIYLKRAGTAALGWVLMQTL